MVQSSREQRISALVKELKDMDPTPTTTYAIEESIKFYTAALNVFSYIPWLFSAKKIDARRLLEINELLPDCDQELHDQLIQIERQKFPGIIEGAVQYLEEVYKKESLDRIRIGSMGSGGCEVERQFIERVLNDTRKKKRLTIVAFDISVAAHDRAMENLASLKSDRVKLVRVSQLSETSLTALESECGEDVLVVFAHNDIFTLDKTFKPHSFTVLMSVLFLHHVAPDSGITLARLMENIATYAMHYDGYRSFPHMIIQSLAGWKHPVFMNAAVFSNLRFWSRKAVKETFQNFEVVSYSHGHFRASTKI